MKLEKEIKSVKEDDDTTFGDLWEQNEHMNIFDCPVENRIADEAGTHTVNIPSGRDEMIVLEVKVHSDLNWSILSEKTVKTGKRASKKNGTLKEKEKEDDTTTDKKEPVVVYKKTNFGLRKKSK